ncbi:MAG: hypothetical protein QCH35_05450 [Methanomicrobiaceae archaeon]|nr:hypothetical protein [Methanomicrobiaceae archaeon]
MGEPDLFILLFVLVLFMIQVVLGIYLLRIYRLLEKEEGRPIRSFRFMPAARTVSGAKSDGDVIHGRETIAESLQALCGKYSLTSCTIATRDGLVVASSLEDADEDAAQYSYLYVNGIAPRDPTIRLFGLSYHGGGVVGIVRGPEEAFSRSQKALENELQTVLDWWL